MTNPVAKVSAGVLPLALLFILLATLVQAFWLMLAVGAVWHETGWLAPISYAGAVTVTWLIAIVKLTYSGPSFGFLKNQAKDA